MVTSRGFSSTRTRHCSVVYSSYRPREPRQSPLTPKHVLPVVENKYLNLLRSRTLNVPRIVCIVYILFLHKKKKKKIFFASSVPESICFEDFQRNLRFRADLTSWPCKCVQFSVRSGAAHVYVYTQRHRRPIVHVTSRCFASSAAAGQSVDRQIISVTLSGSVELALGTEVIIMPTTIRAGSPLLQYSTDIDEKGN